MQTKFVNGFQALKQENPMNRKKYSKIGFLCGTVLLGALTGCVGYVESPHHARGYAPAPTVYVEAGVQDNYVYYPGYQVYYSGSSRQYVYQDGRSWVSRPAPPRVSADVLIASPSVRLDFHDSPSIHHATVVKQYPKHWAPPKSNHSNKDGHKQEGN
jgi:hypothetical protein